MTLLSICGTTFGMSEEALPFYAIFIPIMMGIGYDSMTAFIICFLGLTWDIVLRPSTRLMF